MRRRITLFALGLCAGGLCGMTARADDAARLVKKAAAASTLDQPGTKPFHLKAELAPSLARDSGSVRTGEIEIWWESPTQWRRELHCPIFHQVMVVSQGKVWENDDGDYFPEWLRETAVAVIDPIPQLRDVLEQMKSGEVKHLFGMTHISWMIPSSNGEVQSWIGAAIAVADNSGLLMYGGGFGWGGEFKNYTNFHGRMVAESVGGAEVTAKIATLEDLKDTAGLFEPLPGGGDAQRIQTLLVDEPTLRKNLLPGKPAEWPAVKDGPLEGAVTADIVVDRSGVVREMGSSVVSVNNALADVAREQMMAMRFQPFLLNGVPVQVLGRVTLGFRTVRPVD